MARYRNTRRKVRRTRKTRRMARMRRRGGIRMYRKISNRISYMRKEYMLSSTSLATVTNPGLIYSLASGAAQNLVFYPDLSQIPDWSSIQALFDQVKLLKATFYFENIWQPSQQVSVYPQSLRARVVHDPDDVTPLTAESQYLEYGNCKSPIMARGFKVVVYPKARSEIYNGGYKTINPGFIDAQSTLPQYMGIKVLSPGLGPYTGDVAYTRVRCSLTLACKTQI